MSKTAIVIPARWASVRLPGKPLLTLGGKPLIRHVWERCKKVRGAESVIVATDDMRIAEVAFDFGAEVAMTSPRHPSGTDRIAEVAKNLPGFDIVLNVQGDEPFIQSSLVEKLAAVLRADKEIQMSTAACPLDSGDLANPKCVKAVADLAGNAL